MSLKIYSRQAEKWTTHEMTRLCHLNLRGGSWRCWPTDRGPRRCGRALRLPALLPFDPERDASACIRRHQAFAHALVLALAPFDPECRRVSQRNISVSLKLGTPTSELPRQKRSEWPVQRTRMRRKFTGTPVHNDETVIEGVARPYAARRRHSPVLHHPADILQPVTRSS